MQAQLTEERLRTWLDGNQVQRERMCMALLSLNQKYSDIRPRRPKGGPDGGRDIEAFYDDSYIVWGAVGFRNSANDSKEDKKWIKQKFEDDLKSALDENPNLKGFVFFTNVDLTPAEEAELKIKATTRGIINCEIFYRERLRLLLDSPEGLGLRFQYLNIPLSEAEQAAFFERFGKQLESLMLKQFDNIDKKLARLEFLHDCNKPLNDCKVIASLKQNYSPLELGHFRILFHFFNKPPQQHPIIWISGRDCYSVYHKDNQVIQLFGTKSLTWLRNPDDEIQTTIIGANQLTNEIEILGNIQTKSPLKTLGDFEHWLLSVYVTKPFAEKLNYISLIANDYILVYLDDISYRESSPLEPWPEALTEEEQKIPWVSIFTEFIDFSIYTPYKITKELK